MKYKNREQIFKDIWTRIEHTRVTKGIDYSGTEDVNSNFKRAAKKYNISPEKVLMIYVDKHLDAITTYVNKGHLKGEPIDEKIDDVINYMGILLSLTKEK